MKQTVLYNSHDRVTITRPPLSVPNRVEKNHETWGPESAPAPTCKTLKPVTTESWGDWRA
jgi:hypothetical protein